MTVVDPCDILLAVVARAGIRAGIEPGNEGPCFAVVVRAVVVFDERVAELAVEKASVVVHLPETAVGRDSQPSEHLVRKKLVRSRRTDDAKSRIVRDLRAKALLLRLLLELGQLLAGLGDAQRLFQLAQRGLQRQKLLFIIVVFDHCHMCQSPCR